MVSDAAIERFVTEPPADTRAWGRTMLQRLAGPASVQVDWHSLRVRLGTGRAGAQYWRVDLPDPLGYTRDAFAKANGDDVTVAELLSALGATREPPLWVSWTPWTDRQREDVRRHQTWDERTCNGSGGNDGIT